MKANRILGMVCGLVVVASAGQVYGEWTWTTLDYPGAVSTSANGISGNNIVGQYVDLSGKQHGFLYVGISWMTLDYPGAGGTYAYGIDGNNVVGDYSDSNSGCIQGFLYDGTTWMTLAYPGALCTYALGISGNNIVGSYIDSDNSIQGFLYNGITWTTFPNYPGVARTMPLGISGNSIVGCCQDSSGYTNGFLLTIPKLTLTVINGQWGTVDVEPNLPFYLDANTVVTLTASAVEGKSFNRWAIYDPNYPGDDNYIVYDSNNPTTILMDSSQQVRTEFKCGSGVESVLPLMTLGLGGLALLRRRQLHVG